MSEMEMKAFGRIITRLVNKQNLSRDEAFSAFSTVLRNETTEIQQGAFLAALTAKGETEEEIAGCYDAVYQIDTVKVYPVLKGPVVENSGTGMDSFKTFNISTAASVIAAACGGISIARHGARAITGKCGTVDIAESLGIDVECDVSVVSQSIEQCGLGLFNGMSPKVHPCALGRILSRISFGSTLNIAASLASPIKADTGVRGVYSRTMMKPAIETMKKIGYRKSIVFCGSIDNSDKTMDEASVCGETWCMQTDRYGNISEFSFSPSDAGLTVHSPHELAQGDDITMEAVNFVNLMKNTGSKARIEAALLNAGMILFAASFVDTIGDGVRAASGILESGKAFEKLVSWIKCQNTDSEAGMNKFSRLKAG